MRSLRSPGMEKLPLSPAARDLYFEGRPGDPRLGEWVQRIDAPPEKKAGIESIVLFGNPDDEGVARNRGRRGAAGGPDSIRRHLYKMTPPADFAWEDRIALYDLGNLKTARDIRETHARTQIVAEALTRADSTVIALGGGNDFTAPGFTGFVRAQSFACGIVNIDPHLDVRPLEEGLPHSGTPYRQLIENGSVYGRDVVEFGARANRNSRAAWEFCRMHRIKVMPFEKLREGNLVVAFRRALALRCRSLAVSFDIDVCCDGEGSSAAPVLGFSAWEMVQLAAEAGKNPKVRYFEIVEVAPSLDSTERTSRIAAEMVYAFLRTRSALSTKKKGSRRG